MGAQCSACLLHHSIGAPSDARERRGIRCVGAHEYIAAVLRGREHPCAFGVQYFRGSAQVLWRERGAIGADEQHALMACVQHRLQAMQHARTEVVTLLRVGCQRVVCGPSLHCLVPQVVGDPQRGTHTVSVARGVDRRERFFNERDVDICRAGRTVRIDQARLYAARDGRFAKDRDVGISVLQRI